MDDIDLIEQFGLSQKEATQLTNILKKNKKCKMTPQEKANLLNKIQGGNIKEEKKEVKNMKDMTEEEKKEYRASLKKKLKNKQGNMKMSRTSRHTQQTLSEKVSKNTTSKLTDSINNLVEETENKNEKIKDDGDIEDFLV
jgi:hypothetical protein